MGKPRKAKKKRNAGATQQEILTPLSVKDVFDEATGLPRLAKLKSHLVEQVLLEEEAVLRIINDGADILQLEENILKIDEPVTVVGDVHGQLFDLINIIKKSGDPSQTKYLFLGDYVDRGHFGIEIVLYLWSLKINYPKSFFLLRGNHESRGMTKLYNFERECIIKYSAKVHEACMKAFKCLPLAAVISDKYFCVHGGLSPDLSTIEDINQIPRFTEPDTPGLLFDLLWSDPCDDYDIDEATEPQFTPNTTRKASYFYNYPAVCKFLRENGLTTIIRAHQSLKLGYQFYRDTETDSPSLVTIFSAPNYCGYNSEGALLHLGKTFHVRPFSAVLDAPICQYMDAFSFSLRFAIKKSWNMVTLLMKVCSEDELYPQWLVRKGIIRAKIICVVRMIMMHRMLRQERLEESPRLSERLRRVSGQLRRLTTKKIFGKKL